MTFGVIILGTLLYLYMKKWKWVYTLFPPTWSFDALYDKSLQRLDDRSTAITRFYMTGNVRDYLLYIYIFFTVVICGSLFMLDAFSLHHITYEPTGLFEIIVVIVMLVAGISILFAKSRITAILLNGVLGYGVATLFVLFRAPDLALTQIVIESVTTALFLACFYFLPPWEKERQAKKSNVNQVVLSILVGATFMAVALSVINERLYSTIAGFFENAYELTGGRNIVNAILGDFRAFDTMLEVVVLFIAGLGVYSLIKLKLGKVGEKRED